MAARRFRKNERLTRASARSLPRRPRSAQRTSPPNSTLSYGRERPGRPSHEVRVWLGIRSPTSQDSDYQKRACHGSRNGSDGWNCAAGLDYHETHTLYKTFVLMSDAQDLPQARCNVTSVVKTIRSKAHGSLRRGVPTRRTVLRSAKSSLSIYMRGQGADLEFRSFPSKGQAQGRQCASAFGSPEST